MGTDCQLCQGPMGEEQVTQILEHKGIIFVFRKVPAMVCKRCGYKTFSQTTVRRLEDFLLRQPLPHGVATAFVYDLSLPLHPRPLSPNTQQGRGEIMTAEAPSLPAELDFKMPAPSPSFGAAG